ncbi:hypothetical protein SKTS_26090 [Sulfurimicrobium lacus]|uniref:Lipoprotein n=1 Tax=Sulfurimicrobium lacus TaxID=2715678 RepID=A0A6F8VD22_9PROT|nr:hypothetical protein SKTS_26090 [Sulfurimicrobium lacus]
MQIKTIQYIGYLLLLLAGAACSHVDEITPRSYVGLLYGDTKLVREEIAQALSNGKTVPNAGTLLLKPRDDGLMVVPIDLGWVTAGGAIVVHSKKYGVVVIQEPIISRGKVAWSCIVYPAEAKPNACGS